MKNCINVFFVGLIILTANTSVFATTPEPEPLPEDPIVLTESHAKAVHISIGSIGSGNVTQTIKTVRQLIGHAVGSGVVKNFIFSKPDIDISIPVEGGFTACAESPIPLPRKLPPPFPGDPVYIVNPPVLPPDPIIPAEPLIDFDDLVSQLRSIHVEPGIFLDVSYVENCNI